MSEISSVSDGTLLVELKKRLDDRDGCRATLRICTKTTEQQQDRIECLRSQVAELERRESVLTEQLDALRIAAMRLSVEVERLARQEAGLPNVLYANSKLSDVLSSDDGGEE